jgi:hypothetical protein
MVPRKVVLVTSDVGFVSTGTAGAMLMSEKVSWMVGEMIVEKVSSSLQAVPSIRPMVLEFRA